MNRRHLDNDGLFIFGGLFQREDQLPQILNGVDIVMRRGRNGVGAFRDHPGAGYVAHDLGSRQMSADAGLCSLPHFDLNGRAGHQVVLMDAEATGGYLRNGVGAVAVQGFVKAALAGIVIHAQRFCGAGQTLMGIEADGAVAHGGEQHRHGKFQLRRQLRDEVSMRVPPDVIRLLS